MTDGVTDDPLSAARAAGLDGDFEAGHRLLDELEASGVEDDVVSRVLLERGRLLNTAGDPAAARELFVHSWELARRLRQDAVAVDAAHMVGIVDSPQTAWTEVALRLAQESPDPDARRWEASLRNNLGWALHDQGRYDEALAEFERAVPLREARAADEGDAGREALHVARWCVARALRSLGRAREALDIQRRLAAEDPPDPYVQEEIAELERLVEPESGAG